MRNLIDAVRQNHALEHATMHILNRRYPYLRLMGRSSLSGFYLYGALDTQELADAVSEALLRLQQGERHLAIHPRCGTNLAVTSVLAGAAACCGVSAFSVAAAAQAAAPCKNVRRCTRCDIAALQWFLGNYERSDVSIRRQFSAARNVRQSFLLRDAC